MIGVCVAVDCNQTVYGFGSEAPLLCGACATVALIAAAPHVQDGDCYVGADGLCDVCGVDHTSLCLVCGGRGFHLHECPESL